MMKSPPGEIVLSRGFARPSDPVRVAIPPRKQALASASTRIARSELRERLEIWVNEGGAGGEKDG